MLHHLFLPAGDVQQRPYRSSLPYRAGTRTFSHRPEVRALRTLGVLHLGSKLPATLEALLFSPFDCGGGMTPVGTLNRMRGAAARVAATPRRARGY